MMRARAAAATAIGALALGAGVVLARRDARAITADPEHATLAAPLAGDPLRVVSADGTVLRAEVHGPQGAPSVVLVHGWMCTSAVWRLQARALSERYRVVTYDQRGHGRSQPAPTDDYSADALAADLHAVLDQTVPPGERVVVAGHSMGAMAVVAWAHAAGDEVGERVAGVVLVNAGVEDLIRRSTIIPFPTALATLRGAVGERVLGAPLPLPTFAKPVLSRLVRAVALGRRPSPGLVDVSTDMLLGCPTDVRAAFGATLSTFDLAHGLPALTVPASVIAGEDDRLTPPVHARAIAGALPGSTLVELPGVGHLAPLEAHAAVSSAITALADQVLPANADLGRSLGPATPRPRPTEALGGWC